MNSLLRNNVKISGRGQQAMVFSHGFGCDQNIWRLVAPAFENRFKVVLFDHVGAGASDAGAYQPEKYASLQGYADDLVEIGRELSLKNAIFVGHSVSSSIGVLASLAAPELFERLVLIGPSPRYLDDGDYAGGFDAKQIDELLEFLDANHMGWSAAMAPAIMGNSDRPELSEELTASFCRMDPEIAKGFARATFMADNRKDFAEVGTSSLILQCSEDIIASDKIGNYLHANMPKSELVLMKATGHCPHLSHPAEVIAEIKKFVP